MEMADTTIHIAQDYTHFPIGRFRRHGIGSGEQFREEFLIPALKNGKSISVVLDGTSGYPSSFLEEAFGGLVRSGFEYDDLSRRLKLVAESPAYDPYRLLAWDYMRRAAHQSENAG